MEVVDLFPRSILKGELPTPLLKELLALGRKVLKNPEANPDASLKLAGQLSQQRELKREQPGVKRLIDEHLLPGCERWIRHVIDRQPPKGRGPWGFGKYQLKLIDLWLNCQIAGDYNPTHTHGGSFSGVIFLKTPPQINANSFRQSIHDSKNHLLSCSRKGGGGEKGRGYERVERGRQRGEGARKRAPVIYLSPHANFSHISPKI